jgi:hypothetical protein
MSSLVSVPLLFTCFTKVISAACSKAQEPRRIFHQSEEIKNLWIEERRNMYSSPNIIKEIGRACNTRGRNENSYKILIGNPDGERPLGRYGHRQY